MNISLEILINFPKNNGFLLYNSITLMYNINVGMYLLLYYLLFAIFCLQTMIFMTFNNFLKKANEIIDLCIYLYNNTFNSTHLTHPTPKTQFTGIQAIFCVLWHSCSLSQQQQKQTNKPTHQAPWTVLGRGWEDDTLLNTSLSPTHQPSLVLLPSPALSPPTRKVNAIKENVYFFYPFSSLVSF